MNCDTSEIRTDAMDHPAAATSQLERQTERAQLFTHTALGRQALRLQEVESFAYGLLDVLLTKGVVSEHEVSGAVERVRGENVERGEALGVGVALRVDAPETATAPTVTVNCAERMHICHSICCKLDFALTAEEVAAGAVRWDLGRPYHIRHEADGFCTHSNRATGACGVYACRPEVCRGYSCARDARIWKDFDRMELNAEWLETHLQRRNEPHVMAAVLYRPEAAQPPPSEQQPHACEEQPHASEQPPQSSEQLPQACEQQPEEAS
jgi:Fe-S-cluster containining protein